MSLPRKKIQIDQLNSSKHIQKIKRQCTRSPCQKNRVEKQNDNNRSTDKKHKNVNKSCKKKIKAKFIEQQIDKIMKNRQIKDQSVLKVKKENQQQSLSFLLQKSKINQISQVQSQKNLIQELQIQILQLNSQILSHNIRRQNQKNKIEQLIQQKSQHMMILDNKEDELRQVTLDRDRISKQLQQSLAKNHNLETQIKSMLQKANQNKTESKMRRLSLQSNLNQNIVQSQVKKSIIMKNDIKRCDFEQTISSLESSLRINFMQLQQNDNKVTNYEQFLMRFRKIQQGMRRQKEQYHTYDLQIRNMLSNMNSTIFKLKQQKIQIENIIYESNNCYKELKDNLQYNKTQNIRLIEDKVKLSKQIERMEDLISSLNIKLYQAQQQNIRLQSLLSGKQILVSQLQTKSLNAESTLKINQESLEKKMIQYDFQSKNKIKLLQMYSKQVQQIKSQTQFLRKQVENKQSLESIIQQMNSTLQKLRLDDQEKCSKIYTLQKNEAEMKMSYEQKWQELQAQIYEKEEMIQKLKTQHSIEIQKISSEFRTKNSEIQVLFKQFVSKQQQKQKERADLQLKYERLDEINKISQSNLQVKQQKLSQLKNVINTIRQQSLMIQEQVFQYKTSLQEIISQRQQLSSKYVNQQQVLNCLQTTTLQTIEYMRKRLQYLSIDKTDLQYRLKELSNKYAQLLMKCHYIENQQMKSKENHLSNQQYEELKKQLSTISKKLEQSQENLKKQRQSYINQLKMGQKSLEMIKKLLQDQRVQFSSRLREVQSNFLIKDTLRKEQSQLITHYKQFITEKDNQINGLKEKIASYEINKFKFTSQVLQIQTRIEETAKITSVLQEQKRVLQAQVNDLNINLRELNEQLMIQTKKQKILEQRYKGQIIELTNRFQTKTIQIKMQLSLKVEQINVKNIEIQELSERLKKFNELIKENHQLLLLEKRQNQRLSKANGQLSKQVNNSQKQYNIHIEQHKLLLIQVEKYKEQLHGKNKQKEDISKSIQSYKKQVVQLQNKCQSLNRKNEYLQFDRDTLQKDLQNKQKTFRVLKQQNINLQKVMSDQIAQRNTMIEQLVLEKKILYTQINNQ